MILCTKTPPIGAMVVCMRVGDPTKVWARGTVVRFMGDSFIEVQLVPFDGDSFWDVNPPRRATRTTWSFGKEWLTFWLREEPEDAV